MFFYLLYLRIIKNIKKMENLRQLSKSEIIHNQEIDAKIENIYKAQQIACHEEDYQTASELEDLMDSLTEQKV